jgi:hypothetical protein
MVALLPLTVPLRVISLTRMILPAAVTVTVTSARVQLPSASAAVAHSV